MHRNKELYSFLLGVAGQLTEDWYATLNKNDKAGVYSSTDLKVIKKLKRQNNEFHLRFFQVFVTEEREFFNWLGDWIEDIGQDEQHLNTPIYFILREFFRTQEQYLDYIDRFVGLHGDKYTQEEINYGIG